MSTKPILTIHVTIDPTNMPHLEMPDGQVTMIPFSGEAEGPLFSGKVMPGATDVQITDPAGVRHMCAQYMLEGTDYEGQPCHVFIENHGYFQRGCDPKPFEACPVIRTDSKALRLYFQANRFRAEGHAAEYGVDILIFDSTCSSY